MQVELDGESIQTERDVLESLHRQLFPDRGFGWNRSSLLDALSTDVERPVTIVWKDCSRSCELLGAEIFGELCSLLGSVAAQDIEWGLSDRIELYLA